MENKRKNIYITIFVITTIVASCVAVYFRIDSNKKGKELAEKDLKLDEISLVENTENVEDTKSQNNNVEIKEVEKIVEKGVFPKLDENKWLNKKIKMLYAKKIYQVN